MVQDVNEIFVLLADLARDEILKTVLIDGGSLIQLVGIIEIEIGQCNPRQMVLRRIFAAQSLFYLRQLIQVGFGISISLLGDCDVVKKFENPRTCPVILRQSLGAQNSYSVIFKIACLVARKF